MQILKPIDVWEVENPKKFMTKAHDYSEVISLNVTKNWNGKIFYHVEDLIALCGFLILMMHP